MIDFQLISFFIIAGIMIISAIMVIRCKEVVHSAMFLALTFVMVGCSYIMLNAEYVALVQIIIYAGAITVLMLFAIMLTKRKIIDSEPDEEEVNTFFESVAAGLLLSLILISICAPMVYPEIFRTTLDRQLVSPGSTTDLGALIFNDYVLPLLVVGVLLAVALLAGVFMAREKEED